MPRRAQRRVILFFWPIRASSLKQVQGRLWNHITTGVPLGRVALTFANSAAKPPFEGLHGDFILGMVAGPRRELDITQLLQLAPHCGCIERHRKYIVKPLDQIDQPPAHNPTDRRERTAFDHLYKRPSLCINKPGPGPQSLSIKQAPRTAGIEPHHPVPHDLQTYPADPRSCCSAAAIVYLGQCQKSPSLVRVLRCTRQSSQRCPVKSSRKQIAEPIARPSKTREPLIQIFTALEIPRMSQIPRRLA